MDITKVHLIKFETAELDLIKKETDKKDKTAEKRTERYEWAKQYLKHYYLI